MSLVINRYGQCISGQLLKETITFYEIGENGVEATDPRLRNVPGHTGLWFFYSGENLLIDLASIPKNADNVIAPDSIYWEPYSAPLLSNITLITEAQYNIIFDQQAAAAAQAHDAYEIQKAQEEAAGQAQRAALLAQLSLATGLTVEELEGIM